MSARPFGLWVLGCLGLVLVACDVATVEQVPSSIAQNHCASDADCDNSSCVNSQCRNRAGDIHTVLVEVTPPADGSLLAGAQFLKPGITLPSGGAPLDLDLDLVSQIVGRVSADFTSCARDEPKFLNDSGGFYAITSDSSISAFLTFTPSTTALGLYSQYTVVKSVFVKGSYFAFSVNVPPGDYDIYIEPGPQADDTCPVPPQLRRNQHFNGGSPSRIILLPQPSTFDFHVAWPIADGALNGWYADMLDPVSGRVISNRVQLAVSSAKRDEYVAKISYFPVVVGDTTGGGAGELVRLSPPDKVTAPTVLLSRGALGLFAPNTGTLSGFSFPEPVKLLGQVTAQSTPRPVAATVTLVATKIAGMDPGIPVSFVRSTQTVSSDGQFSLDVLPGTYLVSAVPSAELSTTTNVQVDDDSKLAAVTQEWIVPSTPSVQAGRVVALGTALPINGSATYKAGDGVATAPVQAAPSPASLKASVLNQLSPNAQLCQAAAPDSELCKSRYVPRASTGIVAQNGAFGLLADPGTFDVSVRPLASTGFGWQVFPSVTVDIAGAGINLGGETIPAPVAYSGTVTTPGADPKPTVPNALLRAYVYLAQGRYVDDPSKADAVLQVAETRARNDGSFEILIPTTVNASLP